MIKTAHGLREPNTQRIEKTIISTGMEYGKVHLEVIASVTYFGKHLSICITCVAFLSYTDILNWH